MGYVKIEDNVTKVYETNYMNCDISSTVAVYTNCTFINCDMVKFSSCTFENCKFDNCTQSEDTYENCVFKEIPECNYDTDIGPEVKSILDRAWGE